MKLKRNDKILIVVILGLVIVWGVFSLLRGQKPGSQVEVQADGKVFGVYDLNQDQEILITGAQGGANLLIIKDGYASITEASCPDKLCVHQKDIRADGQTIVCLPNKVVVKVIGGEAPEVDAVAN